MQCQKLMKCMHEEVDTHLLLLAYHTAESGYKSVLLIAEDTDVLIISLALGRNIGCQMHVRCETRNRSRLISINKLAASLGHDVCNALIGLHAVKRCYSVNAFGGQGKPKGLKLLQ